MDVKNANYMLGLIYFVAFCALLACQWSGSTDCGSLSFFAWQLVERNVGSTGSFGSAVSK